MFERLVELLLHAKSGLLAGVFLLGATGALVTATVENGVTTITITTASASPTSTATASPTSTATASPSASPSSSPSASPSSSPKASSSPSACADEAHTINAAVQQVDTAFSQFHTSLNKLHESTKTDANRATLSTADSTLKQIRQDAVKAIHATRTCAGASSEDNDENDQDEDSSNESRKHSSQQNFLLLFFSNLLGRNTTTTSASPTPTATTAATPTATPSGSTSATVTFSGSDPKAIADEAVAAMKLVFDDATAQLVNATPAPNKGKAPTARPQRTPKPTHGHDGGHEDDD